MTMKQHVTIVAALRIGLSLLWLFFAALVFVSVVGGGLLSGDSEAIRITSIVGTVLAVVFGFLAVPGLVAGIGLLKYQNWARILNMILSIWVLAQKETEVLFGCCGAEKAQ